MIYTIGEMAKHLNVPASTLRYYDKEGLLPFVERSGGGIRMFKESDLSWLQLIDCLKRTGMPIKDIKYFMDCCKEGDSKIDERYSIVKEQRNSVLKQMDELQDMLDMLNYKCWYYETAKQAGSCAIHEKIKKENIPEAYHQYLYGK